MIYTQHLQNSTFFLGHTNKIIMSLKPLTTENKKIKCQRQNNNNTNFRFLFTHDLVSSI